mmetsp:Transcript_30859/g.80529  ORF Transcript_30859/g.80529 Transcript_30859/m.80529 type:complete len:336 (-) Transcript_30859:305-1312(-)
MAEMRLPIFTPGWTAQAIHHWRCPVPPHEPLLRSTINGLFAEGLIPRGSIIDAGANVGDESCMYAERQPHRRVHAVEPLQKNTRLISKLARAAGVSNINILQGGLGNESQFVSLATSNPNMIGVSDFAVASKTQKPTVEFQVYRLDDLFSGMWANDTLGFLHLDVEGLELDVIHGGVQTILRDQPILTVEIFVHNRPNATLALLAKLGQIGYRTFIIEEQCGIPADCRNVLCVPISRVMSLRRSATLDLAQASGVLQEVTRKNVASAAYAPVCSQGGKCCPTGPNLANTRSPTCCAAQCVQQWLSTLKDARKSRRHGVHSWAEFEGQPRHGRVFH